MLIVNPKNESFDYILNSSNTTNENAFNREDFNKHHYLRDVIDVILSGTPLKLGKDAEKGTITLTPDQIDAVKDELTAVHDMDAFNKILAPYGIKWSNIYKGTFSKYEKGGKENRGNAFEDQFIKDYKRFEPDIKKIVGYDELYGIEPEGRKNQHRPLKISSKSILCSPATEGNYNIGKTVTDITLDTDKGPIYLSLKFGNTVTFVNAGVVPLYKSFFSGGALSKEGELLLKMLCIDKDKFKSVFDNYVPDPDGKKKKATYEKVDVTSKLKSNKIFEKFMKSAMGHGYILVHQNENGSVDYVDLQSSTELDKFLSGLTKATVEYPTNGSAKRVNVVVKYKHIEFSLNIRNKSGGVNPTHIMADYKFI